MGKKKNTDDTFDFLTGCVYMFPIILFGCVLIGIACFTIWNWIISFFS